MDWAGLSVGARSLSSQSLVWKRRVGVVVVVCGVRLEISRSSEFHQQQKKPPVLPHQVSKVRPDRQSTMCQAVRCDTGLSSRPET